MSKDYWTSTDFDEDLLSVSDFCDSTTFKREKFKPTDHTRRARSKASIYEDAPNEVEEENIVRFSRFGRGYPLTRNHKLRTPGGTPTFLEEQYETTKEIREVCGIGFSNDLIEHSLRKDGQQSKRKSDSKHIMPNIDLTLTNSPLKSSFIPKLHSTPSSSPLHTTSSEQSPRSLKPTHKKEVVQEQVSKVTLRSVSAQQESVQTSENNSPLPIYEIIKLAKHKPAKRVGPKVNPADNGSTEVEQTNLYNSVVDKSKVSYSDQFFMQSPGKSYNINSKLDFPELR